MEFNDFPFPAEWPVFLGHEQASYHPYPWCSSGKNELEQTLPAVNQHSTICLRKTSNTSVQACACTHFCTRLEPSREADLMALGMVYPSNQTCYEPQARPQCRF